MFQNQTCDEYEFRHQSSLKSMSSVTNKLTQSLEPRSPSESNEKGKVFAFPSPRGLAKKKIEEILDFSGKLKRNSKQRKSGAASDRAPDNYNYNSDSNDYQKRNATVKETMRDEAITINE